MGIIFNIDGKCKELLIRFFKIDGYKLDVENENE